MQTRHKQPKDSLEHTSSTYFTQCLKQQQIGRVAKDKCSRSVGRISAVKGMAKGLPKEGALLKVSAAWLDTVISKAPCFGASRARLVQHRQNDITQKSNLA